MILELTHSSDKYVLEPAVMQSSIEKLQVVVAKAYIFFLPVRMISPLIFTKVFVGASAAYFDLILHLLGLILILVGNRGVIKTGVDKTCKLFQFFALMIVCYNLSSIIMAVVIQNIYGNIGSESAFRAVSGMLIYYTQYLFIVYYNKEIFKMLTPGDISKILGKTVLLLLIIGYIQIAVMNLHGVIEKIYDAADFFHILVDSSRLSKLSLTGGEGASAGNLIGILILPFLLARILSEAKVLKNIIIFILWLPIVYFTNSTTAYWSCVIDIAVFLALFLLKKKKWIKLVLTFLIISVCLLFAVMFPAVVKQILPDEFSERIEYLLFEKAIDPNNGSTVSRTIPLLVNWGAFTEYPILGVGNGNQGYFYSKYFPEWAHHVAGSDVGYFYNKAQTEITNGAVFFPSLLSGYGIVGVTLLVVYFVQCVVLLKEKKKALGMFYYIFFMSWAAVLFSGMQGEFVGEYYIWFMLSVPYMVPKISSDRGNLIDNKERPVVSNVAREGLS